MKGPRLIGHRKDGRPIHLIAGGSGEGEGGGEGGTNPGEGSGEGGSPKNSGEGEGSGSNGGEGEGGKPNPKETDEEKYKRIARHHEGEHRKARKSLEDKDGELADLRKQLDGRTAQDQELSTAQRRLARYEVASDLGLPLKMANRLTGDTVEEMRKDAEELKSLFANPLANGGGGGKPGGPDPDEIAKRLFEAGR